MSYINPNIIELNPIQYDHPLPCRSGVSEDGLSGLNIGKAFSRIFDWKGIKRKLPRIAIGAVTSLAAGGYGGSVWQGALTGAAGGIAAAIPKRKAGASFLTDLGVGVGMGLIPGTAIGAYRGLTSPQSRSLAEIGLAGKATQAIQKQFFPQAYAKLNPQKIKGLTLSQTQTLLRNQAKDAGVVTEGAVKSGGVLATTGEVLKASTPLLLSILAGGGGGGAGQGQGEEVLFPGNDAFFTPRGQPQEGFLSEGQGQTFGDGGFFSNGVMGGGGGGGGFMAVRDEETGEIRYIPVPTFWQQYKIYILIGSAAIVGGAIIYKMAKKKRR